MSCSLAVLWAIMAGQSRNSTSVFSTLEVGWSIMIQYSVCSSLICSPSTLSLSKAFHFLIVYLWQQKQPTVRSPKNRQSSKFSYLFRIKIIYSNSVISFCLKRRMVPKDGSIKISILPFRLLIAQNIKHKSLSHDLKKD